jgi:hypothetical protein
MQAKGLTGVVIYFVVAFVLFARLSFERTAYFMLGMLAGAMLCQFAVARMQAKLSPMQGKVLDWEKVERMAEGEQLAAA